MPAERPLRKPNSQRIFDWLDARLDTPSNDQMRARNTQWDYAQVMDHRLWEAEIDADRLNAALRLLRQQPTPAFDDLLDLALMGSPIAMNAVGECYYWGKGIAEDELRGESWFRKSFEAGSQRALLNYGKALFRRGDLTSSEAVFREGADHDWAPALYWLAVVMLKRSPTAQARLEGRRLLEAAMVKGSPAARWRLGRDMANGRFGLSCIPRGLVLLWSHARDTLAAWETEQKARARTTATGETVH